MIVTRQRRRSFPWRKLALPLIALALVIFALSWGPSRNIIANGPLAPAFRTAGNEFSSVALPFNLAQKDRIITDRNRTIVGLNAQISDLQAKLADKSKQVTNLNAQVGQLQTQLANAHNGPASASSPAPSVASQSNGTATSSATDTTGSDQTDAMRRTAQYWANMEPDNAAKVVERLPVPYVARVMSLMSPDAVGAILDALPANVAAQLTQEDPQLKR